MPTGARWPDWRRKIRLDVSRTDSAHARGAPGRHRRPVARRCARQPSARRLERAADAGRLARRCNCVRDDPYWRGLARPGVAPGDRRRRRMHRPPDRGGRPLPGRLRAWKACGERHRGGRRFLWAAAGASGGAGGRHLFAGFRRPAGADLRPGRLGTHLWLPGGCRRAWPQVAAAFQPVDARHRLGLLRTHTRAGRARWTESENVQQLSGRIQAVDREQRGFQRHRPGRSVRRTAVSAGQRRRHPIRHATG